MATEGKMREVVERKKEGVRLLEKGRSDFGVKKWREAVESFEEAVENLQNLPPSANAIDALRSSRLNASAARLLLGDHKEAMNHAQAVLDEDPYDEKALYRLMKVLDKAPKYPKHPRAIASIIEAFDHSRYPLMDEVEALHKKLSREGKTYLELPLMAFPHKNGLKISRPLLEGEDFLLHHPKEETVNNVLVCLHGLGDEPRRIHNYAKCFELPSTAVLSVAAPNRVHQGLAGRAWYMPIDDPRQLDRNIAFGLNKLCQVLAGVQWGRENKRIDFRNVHLYGFGQVSARTSFL